MFVLAQGAVLITVIYTIYFLSPTLTGYYSDRPAYDATEPFYNTEYRNPGPSGKVVCYYAYFDYFDVLAHFLHSMRKLRFTKLNLSRTRVGVILRSSFCS